MSGPPPRPPGDERFEPAGPPDTKSVRGPIGREHHAACEHSANQEPDGLHFLARSGWPSAPKLRRWPHLAKADEGADAETEGATDQGAGERDRRSVAELAQG